MSRLRRAFAGGSSANEQLTAIVATVLVILLAVEGATLFNLSSLLTMHAFVGMLLIPVVALKLATAGWRMVRYYRRGEEYVRRGPPHIVLRVLVAPVIVVTTIVLFATGVALLVRDETHGLLVGLHKASFVVWVSAAIVHVLGHVIDGLAALRRRVPGLFVRLGVVAAVLAAGGLLALATLPSADRLQDRATSQLGLDRR